jgi:hypothetical protein
MKPVGLLPNRHNDPRILMTPGDFVPWRDRRDTVAAAATLEVSAQAWLEFVSPGLSPVLRTPASGASFYVLARTSSPCVGQAM